MNRAHPLGLALLLVGSALSVATSPAGQPMAQTQTATLEGAFDLAEDETVTVDFRVDVSCVHTDEGVFPSQVMLLEDVDVLPMEGDPEAGRVGRVYATAYVQGSEAMTADAWLEDGEEQALALGMDLTDWCGGLGACTVDLRWEFVAHGAGARIDWRAFVGAAWTAESGGACLVFFSEVEDA